MFDHQAHVLLLVLLGDRNVTTVLDQINSFSLSKSVNFNGESLKGNISYVILKDPAEGLVVIKIKSLHILERDWLAKNTSVHGSAEMAVQNTSLVQSLSDDATNKLEEREMLRIDVTHGVGMEGGSVRGNRVEEGVVGIEHLSGESSEPLSGNTAGIDTFLTVEANVELAILDFVRRLVVEVLEGVHEDLVTANVELHRGMSNTILSVASVHSTSKVIALVVKFKHLGVLG